MKSRVLAIVGLVLVILGLLATVAVFAFVQTIREWGDPDNFALGAAVVCLVGCALGWASFKTTEGKAAAIIGSLLVLFFAWQLLRTDSPEPTPSRLPDRAPAEVQSMDGSR
jgi:hypothetical protein